MFKLLDEKLLIKTLCLQDINDFTVSLYQALEPLLKRPFAHAGIKGYLAYLITSQYLERNREHLSQELRNFLTQINIVLEEANNLLEIDFNAWISDKFGQLNTSYMRSIKPSDNKQNLNGFIKTPYTEQQKVELKAKLKKVNLLEQTSQQDQLKIKCFLAYVGKPMYRFFLVFNDDIITTLNDGNVIDRSVYTGVSSGHITVSYGGKDAADTLKIFDQLAQQYDLCDQRQLPVEVKFENPIQVFKDIIIDDLKLIDVYQGETNWWPPVKKIDGIQVYSEKLENLKKEFGITSPVPTHITFKVEQRKLANLPNLDELKSLMVKSPYAGALNKHLNIIFQNNSRPVLNLGENQNIDKEFMREMTPCSFSSKKSSAWLLNDLAKSKQFNGNDLTVLDSVIQRLAINLTTYNLYGFFVSSLAQAKHFLAEDLKRALSDNTFNIDPQIIGSLYSADIKDYQVYFSAWLIVDQFLEKNKLISTKSELEQECQKLFVHISSQKQLVVHYLNRLLSIPEQVNNVYLIIRLLESFKKEITFDEIKKSEILKYAFEQDDQSKIMKELQQGQQKRASYKRWQLWYKRWPAIRSRLDNTINNLGANIISFQEGNTEPLRQIADHIKEKAYPFTLVAFSDQTGKRLNIPDLAPVAEEGYKAIDGGLGLFNALIINHERFNILETQQWWLSETPDIPSPTPGGIQRHKNSLVAIKLLDKESDLSFIVFNTHVTPAITGHEFSQKQIVKLILAYQARNPLPFVLTGDFNTFPQNGLKHYLGYRNGLQVESYCDVFKSQVSTNPLIASTTWLGYHNDPHVNQLDQRALKFAPDVFDHIFLRGFSRCGNAFKYAGVIDINPNNNECSDLSHFEEQELNPHVIGKFQAHETSSDHVSITVQIIFQSIDEVLRSLISYEEQFSSEEKLLKSIKSQLLNKPASKASSQTAFFNNALKTDCSPDSTTNQQISTTRMDNSRDS